MKVKIEKIESVIGKILELDEDISGAKFTVSDSNVLSVAMAKLIEDVGKMNAAVKMVKENKHEDMIKYYNDRVQKRFDELLDNYNIVYELFLIAKDKDRESLLMYLE